MSKIYESGRSMVELIAVLAVMGVLTVGSFWGYTFAIRKNKVNTIVYDISAIDVQYQTNNREEPELPEAPAGIEYELIKNRQGAVIGYRVINETGSKKSFDARTCKQVMDTLSSSFNTVGSCDLEGE